MNNKRATHGGSFIIGDRLQRMVMAEWLMLGSFAVYCFVFPWAMLLLSLDWMPFGMEWMSSLLLAMLGLASGGWLWCNYGLRGLFAGAGIFALGLALEYIGVSTGFPFGAYKYTGVLVPELPGGVPVAIGFAWVLVVVGSLGVARLLLPARASVRPIVLLSGVAALLAVGLDLLLEPVAFHVKNYWVWTAGDGFYGIPWGNFIAWYVAAFILAAGLGVLLPLDKPLRWEWMPVALFGMNVALFGVVNLAHGYWIPAVLAVVLLAMIFAAWMRHRSHLALSTRRAPFWPRS